MTSTPEQRARELLAKLTIEEKIYQVTSDMIFDVDESYDKNRNPLFGSYRNPGHFMHYRRQTPASPAEVTEASRCVEVEDGSKVAPFAPAVTAGSASVPAEDTTVGTAYGPSSNASVPPLSVTADGESEEILPTVRVAPSETVPFAVSVAGKMTWSPAASVGSVSQLAASPQAPPPLVRHVWTVEAAGAKVTLSSSVEELSAVTVKVATNPGKRASMRYLEVSKQPVGPDMTFHVPATG